MPSCAPKNASVPGVYRVVVGVVAELAIAILMPLHILQCSSRISSGLMTMTVIENAIVPIDAIFKLAIQSLKEG